ncbi:MAG: Sau3AI family type II restriction endonuclease [Candidatus Izemoplasmatales bacterium]|nr:Sau3AI family type II restriction endonuclease [Candidatus Izemoplasmatales bacterium]
MYDMTSKSDILMIAESCKGKTFAEIDNRNILSETGNKGALGHVIEMNAYEYDRNANPNKDFLIAGLELKVTPYRKNHDGTLSAKERLVLNMIDYFADYDKDIMDSSLMKKNSELLILFYLYQNGIDRANYTITHILDFQFPDEDFPVIREDYNLIQTKIRRGEAHLISESDTMYLAACTKGANSLSTRKQPFSSIVAKQRAYSLKTTYMTQIIRKRFTKKSFECLYITSEFQKTISFEENIRRKVAKFYGKSQHELKNLFHISGNPKNLNEILFSRMLGLKGKVSKTDEFLKANIVPKTIRINESGRIKESMSFPNFEFVEISVTDWEESDVRAYFDETKFLFIIFRYNVSGDLIFENVKLWNMPIDILDIEVRQVFDRTKEVINSGEIVSHVSKNGNLINNFPGISFNGVCHIRPHGRNKKDVYQLPVADKKTGLTSYTKQSFWLNNSYVISVIE